MGSKAVKFSFSLFGIAVLFASFALAPSGLETTARAETLAPGVMPSQTMVAEAYEQAEIYLAALEVETLPEPEPIVQPQTQSEAPASAAQQQVAQPAPAPVFSGGGSPEVWMAAAGIAPGDWGYVDFIASKESGWNPNATNPTSGACGLIQAYPCSKVPGNGYDPVDNLVWADGYAKGRYGSWQQAYDFWTQNWWW